MAVEQRCPCGKYGTPYTHEGVCVARDGRSAPRQTPRIAPSFLDVAGEVTAERVSDVTESCLRLEELEEAEHSNSAEAGSEGVGETLSVEEAVTWWRLAGGDEEAQYGEGEKNKSNAMVSFLHSLDGVLSDEQMVAFLHAIDYRPMSFVNCMLNDGEGGLFPEKMVKQVMAEIDVLLYQQNSYSGYDEIPLPYTHVGAPEYMVVHDYEAIYPHLSRYEKNKRLVVYANHPNAPAWLADKGNKTRSPEVVQGVVLSSGADLKALERFYRSKIVIIAWAAVQTMLRIVTDSSRFPYHSRYAEDFYCGLAGNSHTPAGILSKIGGRGKVRLGAYRVWERFVPIMVGAQRSERWRGKLRFSWATTCNRRAWRNLILNENTPTATLVKLARIPDEEFVRAAQKKLLMRG